MKSKSFLVAMLFMVTTCMVFVSCSKEDVDENPLVGTVWSVEEEYASGNGTYTHYIEFLDESTVKVWDTTLWSGTYTGSYSIKGKDITFSNLRDDYYKFIDGSYYSSSLKVNLQYDSFGGTSDKIISRIYKK